MNKVEHYYNLSPQKEWGRLEKHRTEFAITIQAIEEYLSKPQAKIIDIGGGPGRYSIELAKKGHEVTLVDLSEGNLDMAKQKSKQMGASIKLFQQGNAKNMNCFEDETFDAVLMLGPMYHLLEENERLKALSEAHRLLKSNGIIFVSFITKNAPIRDKAWNNPENIIKNIDMIEEILTSGKFQSEEKNLPDVYFASDKDIFTLFEKHEGFEYLDMISCEGVISMIEENVNELTGKAWEMWVNLNYRLGKDPATYGGAEHLLYVGMKL